MQALFVVILTALTAMQPDGGIVTVKGHRLLAEIARTERERNRTLAFRNLFKGERCMFVVPPDEGLHPVNTAKFLIAFDVVWLDSEGSVVEIKSSVPPCKDGKECPEYGGKVPSRYHVFLQAGTIRRWNIKRGDSLTWDLHFSNGRNLRAGPRISETELPSGSKKRSSRKRK